MNTMAFVIWVIGWPTAYQISLAYSMKCGLEYSDDDRKMVGLSCAVIWIVISVMLWNKI